MRKLWIAGEWVATERDLAVTNPYDGSTVDAVAVAGPAEAERALAGAVAGAATMRALPAYDRAVILRRASHRLLDEQHALGRLISLEEGKTLAEGVFEVTRAAETLALSADEARRAAGEQLPLDAAPGGAGKLGFTLRVPCGVVLAITPFNFPLNLVCHKVGPALAGGNSVIVKPASDTPLTALRLVEILLECGLPPLGIACLAGGGAELGGVLAADARVRKISFTGSAEVGRRLCGVAGLKRVTMELGSNSPLIVMPDADIERAAAAIVATGYGNAGQVCISTQRVIAVGDSHGPLLDALAPRVRGLRCGDPLAADTQMGPMIRERDAIRVETWIGEAVAEGATLVCGGERDGARFAPTLLDRVRPGMRVCREELFGPAVGIARVESLDEAIAAANDSRYGLSAGLFTRDLAAALRFAREVESGNLHVNWGPGWRADLMPYGGLKESGFGKEGPRYALEEMTELKTVVFHGG